MSSQDVIKTTAKKLKYYMEVKRLEDAFDLSGPDKPQRHYPNLKPRPTLLYDGLHDRALKHYFRNAEVKKHLAQMKPCTSQTERESKVRRDVDNYMEKIHCTSPYTSLVKAKPPPKKRRGNFRGGPLLLRSRHGPQLSKGEADRLVNAATKLLVATETIPLDQRQNGRHRSGKNYREDGRAASSLPLLYGSGGGGEDYGHAPRRPDRPKSTYGNRPAGRPRSSYGERPRPKSAAADTSRPKSAARTSPSTARYGYDSMGRKIKLRLEQPRHYEASESDQDPDDYEEDFEDSVDNSMNILVPVRGRSQSPEWLNIQMSKVDMNDHDNYEEEEEEEEDVEDAVSQGDDVLHSIDNTTQTGRETSCQTVEEQDRSKDTQTRRAETEACMTDPYQSDMAIQTAPPPITSGTQTLVPPPEVSTQTVPAAPTIGTQTFPEVYCQTTPIMNMETQTDVHQPDVGCQVEPPLEVGVQVDPPPPPPSPPPSPPPEPEPEDYEFLKHGPRLRAGKRTIYELSIHTGNRLGASTRADVQVTLYGQQGNTGKIKLRQSRDSKDGKKVKFQKGQIDVFKVESYQVGKIECICIGHDKRELGCGWFLDKVMIREYGDDVTYEFLCERWLSAQDEDGRTVRTIPVTNIIMDVSSSSQSEVERSDYVEKSPDSSAYSDTDLRLQRVTDMDGHFVRTSPTAATTSKTTNPQRPRSRSGYTQEPERHRGHRRHHRRQRDKKGRKSGKGSSKRRKGRTPVTTSASETDTETDSDSDVTSHGSSNSDDDDDDDYSGSSRTGSSSGSDSGGSSSGGSSSYGRKADGASGNNSIRSGRHRDRSSKGPRDEGEEADLPSSPNEPSDNLSASQRTASDDGNASSNGSSTAQSENPSSDSTPKPELRGAGDSEPSGAEEKGTGDYMSGFQAALKMKEQQREGAETAKKEQEEEEAERQRQEAEALLTGPSIHESCKKNDLDRIKRLVQHNAELINSSDERGWTPLHVSAANGRLAVVKYLAANEASISGLTPTGYTAMHLAAMGGHLAVMKVLAAMGMSVECRTVDEQTPLHMAAMSGHLECTKWLVANGAPLDVIDNMGRTAFDLAEEYQHAEVVTCLTSCQRELERQDSSLSMLRSRSPSMGSQNHRSRSSSDSERGTQKDSRSSSDEESRPNSVNAKHKEDKKTVVLERKKSFKDQQERMTTTGMSFLDSIRAEYEG